MIRFFLMATVMVIGLVAAIVSLVSIFTFIKWVKQLLLSGRHYIARQQQDWKTYQEEKKLPDFLKRGNKHMANIDNLANQLSTQWKPLTHPLLKQAHQLLEMGLLKPELAAEVARTFYTVTLQTLEGFMQSLVELQAEMQDDEKDKARQNIEVLMHDMYHYQARFTARKRFNFHVMMKLIKQRLRSK